VIKVQSIFLIMVQSFEISKVECLSLASPFNHGLNFVADDPYDWAWDVSGKPSQTGKNLPETNAIAYSDVAWMTKKKRF